MIFPVQAVTIHDLTLQVHVELALICSTR